MKLTAITLTSLLLFAAVSADAQQAIMITRRGTQAPSPTAPAQPGAGAGASNFTGSVRVEPVFQAIAPGRATGSDVTFEPGARTAWHVHAAGQTLIVTTGVGRVQQWGAPADEIRPGDVVRIPPNVKHWHGASPEAAMSHLAITESLNGRSVEWMELVTDSQYSAPVRARTSAATASRPPGTVGDSARPSVTPRAMNEFAPRLAEITNRVLYGEVWPDSALSQRDRSLVTVSALIAMNRPDQLRSHLARARENGVTRDEVAALITHLAFYAGWPSAVSAVNIANEVFQNR
jgi:4-carboxymuconolactone decarboxylase